MYVNIHLEPNPNHFAKKKPPFPRDESVPFAAAGALAAAFVGIPAWMKRW